MLSDKIRIRSLFLFFVVFLAIILSYSSTFAGQMAVEKAFVCEEITNREPSKKAVVFRNGVERVYCYTVVDQVGGSTVIYHNWYKRDRLSSRIKLNVKSPKWVTFSSIQLRDYDNGPWRVDITDSEGNVLKVVRFSILD